MRIGNFSVGFRASNPNLNHRITEVPNPNGTATIQFQMDEYALQHGFQFKLMISNWYSDRRAEFDLRMSGVSHGAYQLTPGQTAPLERTAMTDGIFTFTRAMSSAGLAIGSTTVANDKLGLVELDFFSEVVYTPPPRATWGGPMVLGEDEPATLGGSRGGGFESYGTSYNAGGVPKKGIAEPSQNERAGHIGQSGTSSQQFGAGAYLQRDAASKTAFIFRLVAVDFPGNDLRSLTPKAPPTPRW